MLIHQGASRRLVSPWVGVGGRTERDVRSKERFKSDLHMKK